MSQPAENILYPDASALTEISGEFELDVDSEAEGETETERTRPADLNEIISCLMAIPRASSLRVNLEVGAVIFNSIFGGDPDALRSRNRKRYSFRSLAHHPGLPFSSTSLWRAVAAYELSLRMPELLDYRHLGIGHVSVVLGLPLEIQRRLLRTTEDQGWSRKRLQDEIKRQNLRGRQRPPESA